MAGYQEHPDCRDDVKRFLINGEHMEQIIQKIWAGQKEMIRNIAGKYPYSAEHVAAVLEQYGFDKQKAEKHIMLELIEGNFS